MRFWATVCKTVALFYAVLSYQSVCNVRVLWPNGWMDQDETWHRGRPRPRPHCVSQGPSSSPKGAQLPNFRPMYVRCGQTAGWIKMPLGTEVDIGLANIVLDGDPASLPQKGAQQPPPLFGPCLLWPNGWMDQDATWYGGRPPPRRHCVTWGPSCPPRKRAQLVYAVSPYFYFRFPRTR